MVTKVIWSRIAMRQLTKAYEYILLDSFQNAQKVKNDILSSTKKLAAYPEMYPPDKYRTNNDGSFRAYEIHHYRILHTALQKMKLSLFVFDTQAWNHWAIDSYFVSCPFMNTH